MTQEFTIRDKVAIAGIGETKYYKRSRRRGVIRREAEAVFEVHAAGSRLVQ